MVRKRVDFGCMAALLLMSATTADAATLTLAWDAVPNVAGYFISYGTHPGTYTNTVDAGNTTIRQVEGLADGTTYYFIVRSYDTAGTMSPPSVEVAGVTAGTPSVPPTIECPAPLATSADGKPVAVTFAPAFAGGVAPVTASCSPASGSLFPVGSTPATCTVVDALQLAASCTTSVVVTHSPPPPVGPPTIMCPAPSATSYDGAAVPVTFAPTVTGGTAPLSATCTPASGSLFQIGSTDISCTATDANKLTASCRSAVLVVAATSPAPKPSPAPDPPQKPESDPPKKPDSEPPAPPAALAPLTLSCPVIPPVTANGNSEKAIVRFPDPTIAGASGATTTGCTPASGSQFAIGTTVIACHAKDAQQRVAACTTSVTVLAPQPPSTGQPPTPGSGDVPSPGNGAPPKR